MREQGKRGSKGSVSQARPESRRIRTPGCNSMEEPSSGRVFPGHSSLGTPELGRGFCTLPAGGLTSLGASPGPKAGPFSLLIFWISCLQRRSHCWKHWVAFGSSFSRRNRSKSGYTGRVFSIYSVFSHTLHVKVGKHPSRDERKADNSGVLCITQAQRSVSRAG